jgi:large repetitive protein
VDNRLLVDNWTDHGPTTDTATVALVAGQRYPITIEFYELGGGATLQLQWLPAGASAVTAVPAERLYPASALPSSNLALGKAATQSSNYQIYDAARAVNGNTDGVLANNSVSVTDNLTTQAWWQVDLGQPRRVDRVQLWNRSDCCADRLNNFVVFVSATDMAGRTLDQLRADPSVMSRAVGVSRVIPQIGIPVGGFGRYVRVQLTTQNYLSLAEVQVFGGAAAYNTPSIVAIAAQQSVAGASVSLATSATDPDGNPLTYSATGLPPGLAINAGSGVISGIVGAAGSYSATVSVRNDGGFSASTGFNWTVLGAIPQVTSLPAPVAPSGNSVSYNPLLSAGAEAQYSWNFGDGSGDTAFAASAATSHSYAAAGVYTVTLTIRTLDGRTAIQRFAQAIYAPGPTALARASSQLLLEPRSGASTRLWVVNQDNDSVSVFDTATNTRLAEVSVGTAPRSVALAADGRVWVVNKQGASISIVNPTTLGVAQTIALPRASQPYGIVFSPVDGSAFVTLEGTGQLLKLNGSTGATLATLATGDNPRHLALTSAGDQLLVSRFISRPLRGEGTASVQTTDAGGAKLGGEVLVVSPATLALTRTLVLAHSERPDTENQGRGIPNYLGAVTIAPDGKSAWVPSKQDNVQRGTLRDGRNLDFQNTVRAISSRIDLSGGVASSSEDLAGRVDHDNSSLASAAVHHPTGVYLFVALETSRQVAVVDAAGKRELFRFDVGLAPQALAVSADGLKLFVSNFMGRSVSVIDLLPLMGFGQTGAAPTVTLASVATDKLTTTVLKGKQLFYDARDPRLARDAYMSCASCHNDGGQDGRTWDFTGVGEGLRNTIALKGRAATAQGFMHWSANFDELQDFEGQIRNFAGGSGLMTDAAFNTGTRSQPLGDKKAGLSTDLDALASYVASLATFAPSPYRNADGTLTAAGSAGKAMFQAKNCGSCHAGTAFTASADAAQLKNIGTIKASSGKRLNGTLTGIDIPTLRDVWATGPYLHDGSAATIADAVLAHGGTSLTATELANLGDYLRQIGSEETTGTPLPASGSGLLGQYFATNNLTGAVALQRTEALNFNWGSSAPGTGVPSNNFSARWTGSIEASATGSFSFQINSDSGMRVVLNGQLVIDDWTSHSARTRNSASIALTANQRYSITVEYRELTGNAVAQLRWKSPGASSYVAVPANRLYLP